MQLLLTDETNRCKSKKANFFVYGGLIIPFDSINELDRGIKEIRDDCGYTPDDELKFDTNTRPKQVDRETATEAKKRVIELAQALNCVFIVHIILHDIIQHQDADMHLHWAANYVIGRFNLFCKTLDDNGICVVDNLPAKTQWRYLSKMFTNGLNINDEGHIPLDRIKLFAATCSNASHLHSAIDIVLGSFRYCINNRDSREVTRSMMRQVVKMMWGEYNEKTDTYHVAGKGFIVRPPFRSVRVDAYRAKYQELFDHINALLDDEE